MARVDDALLLASLGWPVFPCQADKRPDGELAPQGFKDASTNLRQIKNRWRVRPDALVGVAIPPGTVAADIDDREAFAGSGLELPEDAPYQNTPRGGFHVIMATGGQPIKQTVKHYPGMDTRVGGKGYVICYETEAFTDVPIADLPLIPDWLVAEEGEEEAHSRDSGSDAGTFDDDELLAGPNGTTREHLTVFAGRLRWAGATGREIAQALAQAQLDGRIIDGDPSWPWTEKDLVQIALDFGSKPGADKPPAFQFHHQVKDDDVEELRKNVLVRPDPMRSEAFIGLAGQVVERLKGKTEAPDESLLMTFLSGFGALMGPERTLYLGGLVRANLFVSLVGPSSVGRKGTSYAAIRSLLMQVDPDFGKVLLPGVESGQGLVNALNKRQDNQADYRTLLYESEFGTLFSAINRENSSVSSSLRAAYDGSPIGRTVASSSIVVDRHYVGLLGHITPEELRTKMTDVEARNGFGNRILWSWSERRIKLNKNIDPTDDVTPMAAPIQDALARCVKPVQVTVSSKAEELWAEIYSQEPRTRGLLGTLAARKSSHLAKLALIYATLDCLDEVLDTHLEAALAVWDYCEQTAARVFGDKTGNDSADALRIYLRDDQNREWTTLSQALKDTRMRYESVVRAIDVLVGEHLIEESKAKPAKGPGRPARVLRSVEA